MNDTQVKFIPIREAVKFTGIHPHTLRKYADEGTIKCYKNPAGQRMFNIENLQNFCNNIHVVTQKPTNEKVNYIYSRVSSKKQMDDLHRQTKYLQSRKPEYTSYVSITDIASGINFKRKGLQTILDTCLQGIIGEVVIAHKDRLCRFGYELIKYIVESAGGKITITDDENHKTTEQELAEDLLSIVHIYSCKQMGKRSYSTNNNKSNENQIKTNETTTIDD